MEGGDCDTVLFNAGELAKLEARPIVVYAGNSVVCSDAQELLERAGFKVKLTNNVYPAVDELDIVPARHVIHDAFEEHITHAPGMERIGEVVNGKILPTPGAVLIAAERLAEDVGDLVVIDVGGATTDVHSITDGSPEIAALMIEPQPHSKRTVEGDLGTYVSARHVVEMLAEQERPVHLPPPLPTTQEEIAAALTLTHFAAVTGVQRHAGQLAHLYTPTGRQTVARGRDLTACRLVIGTGGALTRLPGGEAVLADTRAKSGGGERLLPPPDARVALDRDYIFACCGALLQHFAPEAVDALRLMRRQRRRLSRRGAPRSRRRLRIAAAASPPSRWVAVGSYAVRSRAGLARSVEPALPVLKPGAGSARPGWSIMRTSLHGGAGLVGTQPPAGAVRLEPPQPGGTFGAPRGPGAVSTIARLRRGTSCWCGCRGL